MLKIKKDMEKTLMLTSLVIVLLISIIFFINDFVKFGPVEGSGYYPSGSGPTTTTVQNNLPLNLKNGLKLYYDFSNSNTTLGRSVVYDISGSNNHGLSNKGVKFFSLRNGNIVGDFDGLDDYVVANNLYLNGRGITVSFWYNTYSGEGNVLHHNWFSNSVNKGIFNIRFGGNDTNSTIGSQIRLNNFTTYPDSAASIWTKSNRRGVWNHFVMTYDGINYKTYINGIQSIASVSPRQNPINAPIKIANAPFYLGGYSSSNYSGVMDEVMIYDRSLNSSELAQLYLIQYSKFLSSSANSYLNLLPIESLISHWSFDEVNWLGPENEVSDIFSVNQGIAKNNISTILGLKKNSASFDGVDDFISVPTYSNYNIGIDDMSWSFWIKCTQAQNNRTILRYRDAGNFSEGWQINIDQGKLGLLVDNGINSQKIILNNNVSLCNNQWRHAVFTFLFYDQNKTSSQYYLDGNFVNNVSIPRMNNTILTRSSSLFIGTYNSTQGFFSGELDEITIYRSALWPVEVKALYEGHKVGGFLNQRVANLDGVDTFISIPNTSNLNISDKFSISLWVKAGNITQNENSTLINKGNVTRFFVEFQNYGKNLTIGLPIINRSVVNGSVSTWEVKYSVNENLFNDDKWHNIIYTYSTNKNSNLATLKLYINGNLSLIQNHSYYLDKKFSISSIILGSAFGKSNFFNGSIDELLIYNAELNLYEVKELYRMQYPSFTSVNSLINLTSSNSYYSIYAPKESSIISYWTFNENSSWSGVQGEIKDLKGGNNAVALNGTRNIIDRLPIPSIPNNVSIAQTNDYSLTLSWNKEELSNFGVYRIYRALNISGPYYPIGVIENYFNSYSDIILEGGIQNYYYITQYANFMESPASLIVNASFEGVSRYYIASPSNVRAIPINNSINISWRYP